jgi:transcriptional repressor NrdR
MQCPSCGAKTLTLETRSAEAGEAVRRRRECKQCGRRFTSFERREPEPAWVIKRDGERQSFDRTKLRAGLIRATHKRPVSDHDVEALVNRIEAECEQAGGELAAERIAQLSLDGLRELDLGAYMQFAGVELADPDAIRAELARIGRGNGDDAINPANRGKTHPVFRPSRRGESGVTPKRRKRGDG